ncbi:MAG: winged helix-turn-helix domain-containing protein [Elusimicrobiota bacterium]
MGNNIEISEKEFAIISEIHKNHLPDQRMLANRTGISLGLTNLIIKRLIKRGYIKAKQLNQKKIQYILTSKGFSEKARKSYNFTLKTISLFKSTKQKLQELITIHFKEGVKEFTISGDADLADITEIAFQNLANPEIKYHRIKHTGKTDTAELIFQSKDAQQTIDLTHYLAESGLFYYGA